MLRPAAAALALSILAACEPTTGVATPTAGMAADPMATSMAMDPMMDSTIGLEDDLILN